MNILITGYNGFVGSNLAFKLKDHRLLGIDLEESNLVSRHYGWDNLPPTGVIDCIIHLAGTAHDRRKTRDEGDYFRINVGLTSRIFDYFLASVARKFIFFSSVKAVADTVKSGPLTEDEAPNPLTPYGRSKLEAERCIAGKLAQWQAKETRDGKEPAAKKVYILRPCMIHGRGNKGNLNSLFRLVSKGIPWPLGAFDNSRSYTSMENLIFVIRQLVERDVRSGTYQIADDAPISTNELIRLIAAGLGKKAKILNIGKRTVKFAAHIGDRMNLTVINNEVLDKLTGSYVVSNNKIKLALGIRDMPAKAEEGMTETLEFLMKRF